MRRFLISILSAIALSGCVNNGPPPPVISAAEKLCGSDIAFYDNYKADIISKNAGIAVLEMYLDDASVALFIKGYNETPPQSHEDSKHIAIWSSKAALDAHLNQRLINNSIPGANVLFIDGSNCITRIEIIPFFALEYLLRGLPVIAGGKSASALYIS